MIVQVPQYRLHNLDTLERTAVTSPTPGASDQLLAQCFRDRAAGFAADRFALQRAAGDGCVRERGAARSGRGGQRCGEDRQEELTAPAARSAHRSERPGADDEHVLPNLEIGIAAAVVFVYLLMAMNFQSWTIPFIILMALPGAFAGIVWILFLTQTTFNVPSLMGALMTIGVATANSILVVSFANESRGEGENSKDAKQAALIAGSTRLRPVCMTALAMIIGMLPMALSLGEGGEQNAPIGRAVIGGLLFATVGTLFIVPVMYSLLSKQPPVNWEKRLEDEIQGA